MPDLTFDSKLNEIITIICSYNYHYVAENLLPGWLPYPIHAQILSSLYAQGFKTPTPIQSKAIPAAFSGKDVIGVAQTVCPAIKLTVFIHY